VRAADSSPEQAESDRMGLTVFATLFPAERIIAFVFDAFAATRFANRLSLDEAGRAASGLQQEINSLQRGVNSLERRAADHEARAKAFREDPTVKPGMEGQSAEKIAAQQKIRAEKLERDAAQFRKQAAEKRAQIEKLKAAQEEAMKTGAQ
jgi:hypothetical protein